MPGTGRAPSLDDTLITEMYSLEPSGHRILKVLPLGNAENGAALLAR